MVEQMLAATADSSRPIWYGVGRCKALLSCKHKKKTNPLRIGLEEAATYSPTTKCSTIGVSELNFSVRNGKRWNLAAITT